MSCLKCLKVAFLPSLFMLQVPVLLGRAGGAGLPGRAPLLGGQRAAARAGHQSGAHSSHTQGAFIYHVSIALRGGG